MALAITDLGEGQVAVLRLHVAVAQPRNDCSILAKSRERITQMYPFLLAQNS